MSAKVECPGRFTLANDRRNQVGHLVWVLGLLVGRSSGAYPMRIAVTLAKVAVRPPVTGHFTGRL